MPQCVHATSVISLMRLFSNIGAQQSLIARVACLARLSDLCMTDPYDHDQLAHVEELSAGTAITVHQLCREPAAAV
jgi:hypothetical protein